MFVFSQDFTVFGGALGEVFAEKIHKVMDLALKVGAPVVGLNDGAGARIQEGVVSLAGYGGIFYRNVLASGVVPQITVILGPCAGGAVYSPAMTDFIFMVRETSHMFITGPDVVKTVTGEEVTLEELGGAMSHASKSGVATFVAADEKACLDDVRYLLSFLPRTTWSSRRSSRPTTTPSGCAPSCATWCRPVPNQPYDMHKVIEAVVDDGEFLEYFPHWARSIMCGFGRVDGRTVGIVGNQPMVLAGVLDIEAAEKAARFVRTCDAFNIPLVTFVDVPGFLPGVDQEHGGIIRHGAKLLYAYCEATVPRIQVIMRKAYGGAYIVMDSKSIGADLSFAWPSAELAVMGPRAPSRSSTAASCRRPPTPRPGGPSWSRSTPSATPTRTPPPSGASSTTSSTRPRPARRSSPGWPCCAPSARSCPAASTATCRSNGSLAPRTPLALRVSLAAGAARPPAERSTASALLRPRPAPSRGLVGGPLLLL